MAFRLRADNLTPGGRYPLIVSGRAEECDLLILECVDARTVVLRYDSWGHGGPVSAPLAWPAGRDGRWEIEMPAFKSAAQHLAVGSGNLRVTLDGRTVLTGPVQYYLRSSTQLTFGKSPFAHPMVTTTLPGVFERLPGHDRSWTSRAVDWLAWGRWQLGLNFIAALVVVPLAKGLWQNRQRVAAAVTTHRHFLAATAVCATAFAAVLTQGRFDLLGWEPFANFYDYQAIALLNGRLDVPISSLYGEHFVIDGRAYGYFGPTPSLLRLPFLIYGWTFGDMARAAMLVGFIAALGGAYALLSESFRWVGGRTARPAPIMVCIFVVHVGLGSSLFFLGSRAFTYHEALLWGVAFATWSAWGALKYFSSGRSGWWVTAFGLGLLALHARPPAGLFALVVLAGVSVLVPSGGLQRKGGIALALLALAGIASFNALSYLKFGTFEGCPLRLNNQYTPERLAHIESKQFRIGNVPYGLDTYFLQPRVAVRPQFPWLYLPPTLSPDDYRDAKLDLSDHTAALPAGMPGLFGLATVGLAWTAWRRRSLRGWALALGGAFALLAVAMCAAVATAERYTADFVPFLIVGGALGLAALNLRRRGLLLLAIATAWAIALTLSITLNYQARSIWGVPPEIQQSYEAWFRRIDRITGAAE